MIYTKDTIKDDVTIYESYEGTPEEIMKLRGITHVGKIDVKGTENIEKLVGIILEQIRRDVRTNI
ncbi:MAG TPA: hypothetical protein VFC79_02065 [Tissierellaceae bacterium]|nr:hypothetical protein [Tissierellaceae bacterium]